MEKSLILLRGLPGSGKTTLANILSETGKYPVLSIDDYFTDPKTGVYSFEYQNNHLAYKACEQRTDEQMQLNKTKIIIHNTFTMDWELEPYFKLAQKHNYTVYVVTVEKHHKNSNVHNISEEQISKMAEKYSVKLY